MSLTGVVVLAAVGQTNNNFSAHQSIVWQKSQGQTSVAKGVNSLAGRENKRKQ